MILASILSCTVTEGLPATTARQFSTTLPRSRPAYHQPQNNRRVSESNLTFTALVGAQNIIVVRNLFRNSMVEVSTGVDG